MQKVMTDTHMKNQRVPTHKKITEEDSTTYNVLNKKLSLSVELIWLWTGPSRGL
jgi:hypothetical protein